MGFFSIIANLAYAGIDLVAYELIFTIVFRVKNGRVKFFFDWLFGLSKFVSTTIYAFVTIVLGVIYFFVSGFFQDKVISILTNAQWATIPVLIAIYSFFVFWLAKLTLGRKWRLSIVWISLVIFIISFIVSILSMMVYLINSIK